MDQALQNQWAETTLNVVRKVASKRGAAMYRDDWVLRDDLNSWLTVKAQEAANRFEPDKRDNDPETQWVKYLTTTLTLKSRWHWAELNNNNADNENALRQTTRLSALLEDQDGKTMSLEHRMTAVIGLPPLSPQDFMEKTEWLNNLIGKLESDGLTELSLGLCIEPNCLKPHMKTTSRCTYHHIQQKELWNPGARCTTTDCTDRATKRGMCSKHYSAARQKAKRHGEQWNTREPAVKVCTVEDCGKPHNARGLCNSHLAKQRRERMGPCTIPGCTNKQNTKQMCHAHYAQARKGKLNG